MLRSKARLRESSELPVPEIQQLGASEFEGIAERYGSVRRTSEILCAALETEDYVVQSMPDVSPAKWHLAHVSWFFETFLLKPGLKDYTVFDSAYETLFNSYYNSVGAQYPRPKRGLITRPTVGEIFEYRRHVDEHMRRLLGGGLSARQRSMVTVGIHHEQQHQELLLMDLKHVFSQNPLFPEYTPRKKGRTTPEKRHGFRGFSGGTFAIGHDDSGFAFDNERPRHRIVLEDYELGNRLITNREYADFINDGGYESPLLWLSDGWSTVQAETWRSPLYWLRRDGAWWEFTLSGLVPLQLDAPVTHLSLFEADAYATWAGARLPREGEWEVAVRGGGARGQFMEGGHFHPQPAAGPGEGMTQLLGDTWEWTQSAYGPYPGFKPAPGALGEYNGKFMCNQFVLRGGSCLTPESHARTTYRNFFYPHQRWASTGLRLARDATS